MNEINADTIHRLRERRIVLLEEIDTIDDELKGLGVNPNLSSLVVSILKVAERPLTSRQLYDHTLALGIHAYSLIEFNRHLDRLHAAGSIMLATGGNGSTWIVRRQSHPYAVDSPQLSVD